jgi:dTMP kinase
MFDPMKPDPPVTIARIEPGILVTAEALGSAERARRPSAPADPLGSVGLVRGLFVTFEGIDRSGKTTQSRLLLDALGDEAVGVREPGGTPAGERIRSLLKDPDVELSPEAEALLFAAARAELVSQVIEPALAAGKVVVSDRFLDSSLAYQGSARGLGVEEVERINAFATAGLRPDLTLLLDLDTAAAAGRGAVEDDRFEQEGAGLQRQVAAAYDELAGADPGRWRRIPADRDPRAVHGDVLAAVQAARKAPA